MKPLDRKVVQTTPEGRVVSIFTDIDKVAKELEVSTHTLLTCIYIYDKYHNSAWVPAFAFPTGNFRFMYEDKANMHEQINQVYMIVEPDPIELVNMLEKFETQ